MNNLFFGWPWKSFICVIAMSSGFSQLRVEEQVYNRSVLKTGIVEFERCENLLSMEGLRKDAFGCIMAAVGSCVFEA